MSKFEDKKKEIMDARAASTRKTFNEEQFNELFTALVNEPDYETVVAKSSRTNGYSEEKVNPVKDFRKSVIGSVMKAAGHDSAETEKFINEHKFSTIDAYPVISEAITEYISCGKAFNLSPKPDMTASIFVSNKPEEVKEVRIPASGEVVQTKMGAYKKVCVKSVCPAHLRVKVDDKKK